MYAEMCWIFKMGKHIIILGVLANTIVDILKIHLLETGPHEALVFHFRVLFQAFLQTTEKHMKKCKNSSSRSE